MNIIQLRKIKKEKNGLSKRHFLLKAMPKKSICAEIGVDRGFFSLEILDIVKPSKLHLIDPWKYEKNKIYELSWYGGVSGMNQANMDLRYQSVINQFKKQIKNGQIQIHRGFSYKVCENFEENYFDWIYVDGNHLYKLVKKDLELYFNKVKNGGFITGDDYGVVGWWKDGVTKAVDEFIVRKDVKVVKIEKIGQFIFKKEAEK